MFTERKQVRCHRVESCFFNDVLICGALRASRSTLEVRHGSTFTSVIRRLCLNMNTREKDSPALLLQSFRAELATVFQNLVCKLPSTETPPSSGCRTSGQFVT